MVSVTQGVSAKIFHEAAARMPKLILEAAFAEDPSVSKNMQKFMDSWAQVTERAAAVGTAVHTTDTQHAEVHRRPTVRKSSRLNSASQWPSGATAQAEAKLDDTDMKLITSIVRKDRGPFLYWLVNERRPAFAVHAGHDPNVSRPTEHTAT